MTDLETLRALILGDGERIDAGEAAARVLAAGWRQGGNPTTIRIPYDAAVRAFGAPPNLNSDMEREAFFAVWAMLQTEIEAALAEARKEPRS